MRALLSATNILREISSPPRLHHEEILASIASPTSSPLESTNPPSTQTLFRPAETAIPHKTSRLNFNIVPSRVEPEFKAQIANAPRRANHVSSACCLSFFASLVRALTPKTGIGADTLRVLPPHIAFSTSRSPLPPWETVETSCVRSGQHGD